MTKTLLAIVQDVPARVALDAAAAQLGYHVEHRDTAAAEPTDLLVALQPWLIVLDLQGNPQWQQFIINAKTSPATRKMPLLVIAPDGDAGSMESAKKAGANAVVTLSAFLADIAGAITKHARVDESAELLRQAQLPLPEMAKQAIEQFNRREFWEQHETFEHVWKDEPGPVRQMYQGILQVGVAYLQIQRKNYIGARKLFQRAWQYLNVLPDVCQGVDIAQLKTDTQAALTELERLGPEGIVEFPDAMFKPVRYAEPA
jgi:predicted metal-dependent hydrolase